MSSPVLSLLSWRFIAGIILCITLLVIPGSGYVVMPGIGQGATVFIGENGLDISPALDQAQALANSTSTTIGWWDNPVTVGTRPASKTFVIPQDTQHFFADPAVFAGWQGNWYLTDPETHEALMDDNSPILVLLVADPMLDIRVWDLPAGLDVYDKTVPYGDDLTFRVDTAMTSAFNGKRSSRPGDDGTGYVDIIVKNEGGERYTSLLSGSVAEGGVPTGLTAQAVTFPGWFWGSVTRPDPAGPVARWATGARNPDGSYVYPAGVYVVWAESRLNGMVENYRVAGADYTTKTVSQGYAITLAPESLRIRTDKAFVVRNNPFSVTITGRFNTPYNLWVRGTSSLDGSHDNQPPMFQENQAGVIVGDPRVGDYAFQGGGLIREDVSPYLDDGVSPFFANVTTNSAGMRTVALVTTTLTKSQRYTIRVERSVDGTILSDEATIDVGRGNVTIVADGDEVHHTGDQITFSGTNAESAKTYLFLTGPGLPPGGAQIFSYDPASAPVIDNDPATFAVAEVADDRSWSWRWDTEGVSLESGTYTIYAVSGPRYNTTESLSMADYGTVSLIFKNLPPRQPLITVDPGSDTIPPGTNVTVLTFRNLSGVPLENILVLVTDLEDPTWTYSVTGEQGYTATARVHRPALDLPFSGLIGPAGDSSPLNITLTGRYPDTTGPVVVFRIQDLDGSGKPVPGSTLSEIRPKGFQLSPFPGYSLRPGDRDSDGVYEDLNGNGRQDFDDVIVLFANMERIGADGTVRFFDFNRNNRADFDDVIRVFSLI